MIIKLDHAMKEAKLVLKATDILKKLNSREGPK